MKYPIPDTPLPDDVLAELYEGTFEALERQELDREIEPATTTEREAA